MSHDKSAYGKRLLEVGKNNHIFIFNGRVGENHRVGKASTVYSTLVDHVIGSPVLFTKIKNFKVMNFDPLLSDVHCGFQVNFKIDIMCNIKKIIQSKQLTNTKSDKPGKWKSYKAKEYVDEIDVDKVNNLLSEAQDMSVQDLSVTMKHLLVDPALKVFPCKAKRVYIKHSNQANMPGYDGHCWHNRKEYHKARHRYNVRKSDENFSDMIEKSRKYKSELNRVKQKERENIVRKLRENKKKDPRYY